VACKGDVGTISKGSNVTVVTGPAACRCVSADFAHGAGDDFDLGAMGSPPEDASVAEARARRQRGPPPTPLSDCLQVQPASP
jgi:hypothetical protein